VRWSRSSWRSTAAGGVVGSGIMGERLADGNVAIALLANTLGPGAALVALILTFGHVSGAHFNPAVLAGGGITSEVELENSGWGMSSAQILGALSGVARSLTRCCGEPLYSVSHHTRSGFAQVLTSEAVATFGLLRA